MAVVSTSTIKPLSSHKGALPCIFLRFPSLKCDANVDRNEVSRLKLLAFVAILSITVWILEPTGHAGGAHSYSQPHARNCSWGCQPFLCPTPQHLPRYQQHLCADLVPCYSTSPLCPECLGRAAEVWVCPGCRQGLECAEVSWPDSAYAAWNVTLGFHPGNAVQKYGVIAF